MSKISTTTVEMDRKYGLPNEKVKAMVEEYTKTKVMPNPYRGNYGAIVAALKNLGVNKPHKFVDFRNRVKAEMGREAWAAFDGKDARNPDKAKDSDGRLHDNARVLQRPDYGLKLKQLGTKVLKSKGCCIDIIETANKMFSYSLNTDAAEPTYTRLAKPKAVVVAKVEKKAAKSKPTAKKGKKAAKATKRKASEIKVIEDDGADEVAELASRPIA